MRPAILLAMAIVNGPVASDGNFPAPGCAIRCWENTKYISKCTDKHMCLCYDAEYQNVSHTIRSRQPPLNTLPVDRILTYKLQSVFKCLHSQCDTAHFGTALHHTITQCFGVADNILLAASPLSNHDSLRRREAEYLRGVKLEDSESIVGYPTLSALPMQSALPFSSGVAFPSIPPLLYLTRDTVTAAVTASVTAAVDSVQTAYNTAPEFITASPLLYTGDALRILPSTFFLFLSAYWGLYLAI
ncbi:hypothetical protein SBOR_9948 [Sclerotinia borealis F-4128]|uniref:Extracellular membrane protein CFEM domain-containing protein n=1 Tax=Sclerotinia borealis (strain F-4128) TaxID=1432307 RepID=W9BYJ0_SCLBF|nr:hypothetical protein SBOR_9948 [Sclerotinia borealis F-4128]